MLANKNRFSIIWWCVLSVLIIGALVFFLVIAMMRGNTVISNSDGTSLKTQSLSCAKNFLVYPFLKDPTEDGSAEIKIVFNDDILQTISLVYHEKIEDTRQIESAETQFRISLNEAFSNDNLKADSLGVVVSAFDDAVQFSLYAEGKEVNGVTAKYFLLDRLNRSFSFHNVLEHYTNNGFACH